MGSNELPTWINEKLVERGWSIRELGRRIGVSSAHATRIVNGDARPSIDLCQEIAQVFNVAPNEVMAHAGILPPLPDDRQDEETILALFRELPEDKRDVIIDMMKGAVEAHKVAVTAKDE